MNSPSYQNFTRGLIRENPTLVMLLGMCPTLGVTTSALNGLGMGLATLFVLLLSNTAVSAVKNFIPAAIRIPCYITIIASFVTVVELLMAAYSYLARRPRHLYSSDCRQLYYSRTGRSLCLPQHCRTIRP